jgi:hypothetical protein
MKPTNQFCQIEQREWLIYWISGVPACSAKIANSAGIASKIEKEYLKGHLPKHDARARYKRPRSIHSEVTRATAEHWASIKDATSSPTTSDPVASTPSMEVRNAPLPSDSNPIQPESISSESSAPKHSGSVCLPRKLDNTIDKSKKKSFSISDRSGKRTVGEDLTTPSKKRTRHPRATKDKAIDAIKDTMESMRIPFSDKEFGTEDSVTSSTPVDASLVASKESEGSDDS